MEQTYCMLVLPYLASQAVLKQKQNIEGSHILESEQKAAMAMLGLSIGKCVLSQIAAKIVKTIQKRILVYIENVIFIFVLFIVLSIDYLDKVFF